MVELNHTIEITQITGSDEKSNICRLILSSLPDWFGIPEAIDSYTNAVQLMPFYLCSINGQPVGFVALKVHNSDTAEVFVMGVLSEYHRQGIGKKLIDACNMYCIENGHRFLTVKTLADTHPDEGYAKTRMFYLSMGFRPLEVFTHIWDESNPCLFMVKCI